MYFYPSDFLGMPSGQISAIYLRVGDTFGFPAPAVYNNLTIKIGYTTDSFFKTGSTIYDTFKTGLATILNAASFTVQGSDTVGKWIKIPVDAQLGNFVYDPKKMFVVEVAMGPKPNNTGFHLMATNLPVSGTKPRTLGGNRDSLRSKGNSTYGNYLDLGIDLSTKAGVGTLSNLQTDLSPNPTKGLTNISLSTREGIKELSITVYAANGAKVIRRSYGPQGTEFHTALDVSNLPPGIYGVIIKADGATAWRRLLIQ